ncbi:MAG: alpha-L-fucosidase [Flavitalea sp.]
MKKLLFSLLFVSSIATAQHKYVAPTDTLVKQKLSHWQDLKFGLFMHWGTYSQWGVVESWSLCPEDEDWTKRRGPYSNNYFDYVTNYEKLQTTFNPTKFDPSKWAAAAKKAGMKYVVFTTKHHDGFNMFDTKYSDYKITDKKSPFASNPKANVAKEVFDAFRKENFMAGAYFSKPDWHSKDYWWPYLPPKDRNVNYDPKKYPERWQAFKDFTYNQVEELMSDYGKLDILWLDGGWVRPLATVDTSVEWQRGIKTDQDIDMKRIAGMARSHQPGLIVVDRTVTGEFENYTTPEQEVPHEPLPYPWETCMTMGDSWSYVPNDKYKSAHQLIHLLVKVVSRGGNFLLNIGPGPDGDWDPVAYQRLEEIGKWMEVNGVGIYDSKSLAPYSTGNTFFTQSKDGSKQFAYYLVEDSVVLTKTVTIKDFKVKKNAKIRIAGGTGKLKWKQPSADLVITLPGAIAEKNAVCFVIE